MNPTETARNICPRWMHPEHNAHYQDVLKALQEAEVEVEKAKADRNRAGVEERQKYIPHIKAAHDLIAHIHVHEGYKDCGFMQMTTEQKQLFISIMAAHEFETTAARLKESML